MSVLAFATVMLITVAPADPISMPLAMPALLPAPTVSDPGNSVAVLPAPTNEPSPPIALPPIVEDNPPHHPDMDQNEILVSARKRPLARDPFEVANAKSFAITQAVDIALIGPAALAYARTVPAPVRSGFRNVLNNLREPTVFINFLIQFKPGKAGETFGRFAINSTLGGAGLFDVAKRHPFNLPRRPNGFADTMGFYGVKPGPFLFLPLIGPTTLRDLIGGTLDRLVLPTAVGKPFTQLAYTIPTGVISALDHRAEFDVQLHKFRDESANPYAARREFYLQGRQAEIDQLRGRHLHSSSGVSDPPHPATELANPSPSLPND